MNAPVVTDLFFYPIKSFRGFRVKELRLLNLGAELDRQWMLVDEKNQGLTQRQLPQLARIGVGLDDFLELTLDGFGSVDFGLEETEGPQIDVTVWDHTLPAFEVSGEVSEWLTQVLSKKVKLVRLGKDSKREVRFHDQQQMLILSKASLQDLENRVGTTMSVSRFRPNMIVDGVPAYAEDNWTKFKIGLIEFTAVKPCTRCKVTTVHPLTGEVGEEPLKTLMTYRKSEKGVNFGHYYTYSMAGKIHAGQELTFTAGQS